MIHEVCLSVVGGDIEAEAQTQDLKVLKFMVSKHHIRESSCLLNFLYTTLRFSVKATSPQHRS